MYFFQELSVKGEKRAEKGNNKKIVLKKKKKREEKSQTHNKTAPKNKPALPTTVVCLYLFGQKMPSPPKKNVRFVQDLAPHKKRVKGSKQIVIFYRKKVALVLHVPPV